MTLIHHCGSYEQLARACLDAGTARDIALMLDDAHTVLDWLARGELPEATRQATAVLAGTDSPYDLQHLAGAVSQTATRLHHAVRDALAGIPDHPPGD
jgi:hypothetical protein